MTATEDLLDHVLNGSELSAEQALAFSEFDDLQALMDVAARLRDLGHGDTISYSKKVFIPLTKLCRDTCRYCTFARPPRRQESAYLSPGEVLSIARAGVEAGCREALFTLGDKPELRYRAAQDALAELGRRTTLDYLAAMSSLVLKETGLLPHVNAGVMGIDDIKRLRAVSVSQGIMLESVSDRLTGKGGPHFGSPDKVPTVRLATIAAAGEAAVPFTSGILVGIGETRRERIEALLALRELHRQYRHIQEVIIQNFRAKPGTPMADTAEPTTQDHIWTIAVARIVFGPEMNIQAPPNLSCGPLDDLIAAGINDWGGVSPVTPDHVNPEAPWPALTTLEQQTAQAGKVLVGRLALYPEFVANLEQWVDASLRTRVLRASDSGGFARADDWMPGAGRCIPLPLPLSSSSSRVGRTRLRRILDRASAGETLSESDIATLFSARGTDFYAVCEAADSLRAETCGDRVTYVVNRNINYTNICSFRCKFCAFAKGKLTANLRGRPYRLGLEEIKRRSFEAWSRGATEVCLQGGIHPAYTGETYLEICRAIKEVAAGLHIHGFSPLEIWQGASTLGVSIARLLMDLKEAGLGTLPGTAAEILDDGVRAQSVRTS